MDPEIEAMQRRLKEMEDEAAKLKDEDEKVGDAMSADCDMAIKKSSGSIGRTAFKTVMRR